MLPGSFGAVAASAVALVLGFAGNAGAAGDYRVSGPFVHDNLAIYLLHGKAAAGPVPLTLQEALAKGSVRVHETGNVNQLDIENLAAEEVFIQSGDIVKGGQQDRVLMVSLLLPPRSGRVAIASFCVEQGRWSGRGKEDAKTFASAAASLPSRKAKMAINAPTLAYAGERARAPAPATTSARQQEVWESVANVQQKLTRSLGSSVAAPQSRSSLQLSLENKELKQAQASYVSALQPVGEKDGDVIGYVLAINGKLNSAEVYPSNALFRKMWAKLLNANATEAIGEKSEEIAELPSIDAVTAFLAASEQGEKSEKELPKDVRLETRDSESAVYSETRRRDGAWVHKSYLAK
jgi:hypothetical protein